MKNRSIKVLLSFILTAAMLTGMCVLPVNAEESDIDTFKLEFEKKLEVTLNKEFWYQYYTNMKDDEYEIIYAKADASNQEKLNLMKETIKELKIPSERLYKCSFYDYEFPTPQSETQCTLIASFSKEEITKLILSPVGWSLYFFYEDSSIDWFTYDASDALNILRYAVGLETKIEPSSKGDIDPIYWANEDIRRLFYDPDHDGTISANDAVYALQSSVGLRKIFFNCSMNT